MAALFLTTLPAQADVAPKRLQFIVLCGSHSELAVDLKQRFDEAPTAMGMSGSAYVMEMFVNQESGTWSFVLTTTDGESCIFASGTNYEAQEPPKEGA